MFKITAAKKRNYIFKITKWLEILFAILVYSCNAPRSNPIDPNNPGNSFSVIDGNVSTSYIPLVGIPDVLVYWVPENRLVKTDINGYFIIDNIKSTDGNLIFEKEGFKSDTLLVIWNGSDRISKQVHLNSLPQMEYLNISTSVEFELSGRTAEVHFLARVTDKDSQIDSVYVENSTGGLKRKMELAGEEYSLILNETDLQIDNLEVLIGKDFNLYVADSAVGTAYNIGSGKISRIIYNEPITISPVNSDSISSSPVLEWNQPALGFNFNYLVEIYINETGNNELIYSSGPIDSGTTVHNTGLSLLPGEYFWVIWVVDQLNNRARSRPALFVVQ
jgi:hypothetical protein